MSHLEANWTSNCVFFTPFSRKWAKVPHWLRRPGPELPKASKMEARVSKYGPRVIKMTPEGVQIQPAGLENTLQKSHSGK